MLGEQTQYEHLQVTMTATRRLEVLERTLSSFRDLMFGENMGMTTLFLNVDPIGECIPSLDVVALAKHYFGKVIARCPKVAHFPTAFRWCWAQVTAPFVFHLEDDWELMTPVSLDHFLFIMMGNPRLLVLRLPFTPCTDANKSWNHFLPYNKDRGFYEVPEDRRGLLGFCGHPSILRREFVEKALPMLNGIGNPEKQLKWRPQHELQDYDYGVYGYPGLPAVVRDIGREWRIREGWGKVDNDGKDRAAFFTMWKRVQGGVN